MSDPILESFLRRQEEEVRGFGAATDGLVEVLAVGGSPADRYVLSIRAKGLVQDESGAVVEFEGCGFGIVFGADHLASDVFTVTAGDQERHYELPGDANGVE